MFKSKVFYWLLIIGLSMLLLMNLFILINTGRYVALLPITVQTILLMSVLVKHRYTKLFLQVWLIVFFVIAPGLQIIGRLLKTVGGNGMDWAGLCPIAIQVCVGIIGLILLQRNIQNLSKS